MAEFLGQIAALGTSCCWSATSVFFTLSGRQVGSVIVNRTRLVLAVGIVALMHLATQGTLVPVGAGLDRWGLMGLSGAIGFVVGDSLLFQAFVLVGPRLSMLMMALVPVMSVLLGWVFLGERLTGLELAGIALAVSGIALVVTDRPRNGNHEEQPRPERFGAGLLFGLGGALGQAGGLMFSKMGLAGDYPALSGSMMRLIVATTLIWAITLARRQARPSVEALRAHPRALLAIAGGAVFGPFLGVWLSLIAVQRAPIGIASTLMSLPPIILLPVGRILFDERIGLRAVGGTVVAVAGSALLFL
jgi:drug/metabolite transporter (DMT)-like permease